MEYANTKSARIPKLGFGTWRLKGREAREMTEEALRTGYRHIDTAQMYGNEAEVGAALKASGLTRADYWLTTKIWFERLGSVDEVRRSVEDSLRLLGAHQVDLLLIHWPHPSLEVESYFPYLVEMRERGYTRFIGVSNFTPDLIERAAALDDGLINDQVEYHPLLDQREVLSTCRRHGMTLTAYSPLAQGQLVDHELLTRIGEQYGRSPAQVARRWLVQQDDVIAIPKTSHVERLRENFDIFSFELTDEEMQRIFRLAEQRHRLVNPSFAPDWS